MRPIEKFFFSPRLQLPGACRTKKYYPIKISVMKHSISTFKVMLSVVILLSACSKSDSSGSNPPPSSSTTTNVLTSGNWAISSFTQKSEDKTADFAGSVFSFATGGKASATVNGTSTNGTWSYSAGAAAYYGNPATDPTLTLNFGDEAPMNELKGTWIVESLTSSVVQLRNQEANDDEHVKFSKQ